MILDFWQPPRLLLQSLDFQKNHLKWERTFTEWPTRISTTFYKAFSFLYMPLSSHVHPCRFNLYSYQSSITWTKNGETRLWFLFLKPRQCNEFFSFKIWIMTTLTLILPNGRFKLNTTFQYPASKTSGNNDGIKKALKHQWGIIDTPTLVPTSRANPSRQSKPKPEARKKLINPKPLGGFYLTNFVLLDLAKVFLHDNYWSS